MGSTLAAPTMGSPLPPNNLFVLFRKRHERLHSCHSVGHQVRATTTEHHSSLSTHRTLPPGALPKTPWSIFHYLVSTYLPKLILEVLGGAGAIWGFSEACGLRRPETEFFWRPAALVIGGIFLLRFLKELVLDMIALRSSLSIHDSKYEKSLEVTSTTTSTTLDSPPVASTTINAATTTTIMMSPTKEVVEVLQVSPSETKPLKSHVHGNLSPRAMMIGAAL